MAMQLVFFFCIFLKNSFCITLQGEHKNWKMYKKKYNRNTLKFRNLRDIDNISRFPAVEMTCPRSYLKMKDEIYNFPLKKDDIWIVTFPKCGTTWMQETVSMLVNDVNKVSLDILMNTFYEILYEIYSLNLVKRSFKYI